MTASSSSSPALAFAVTVLTPLRSASGWTRGMPPPRRVGLAPAAPRATLSEPAVQPSSNDKTIADFIKDPDTPKNVNLPEAPTSTLDDLVARLEHDEPRKGGSAAPARPRRAVISNGSDQTLSVHAGERVRGGIKTKAMLDAIQTPIVQSATYTFRSTQDCIDYNLGRYESFEYARYGNPTVRAVEEKLMALDRAEDCLLSASGMNSVTTMLLALVPAGGHIVTTTDCYRRTRQFVRTVLPRMGIGCTVLDPADLDQLAVVIDKERPTLYFSETPTNPLMRVVDVERISHMCRAAGVISVFDTTFATAVNFRPIDFDADLVLHSATKYIGGHQDVMAGAILGRADLVAKVRKMQGLLGGIVDPHTGYLINRGLKTLGVRMQAHNRNAETIARRLADHPKVARVHHPTLPSHPDHAVAQRIYKKGFGGMLSFELVGNGDPWSAETFRAVGRFVDALRIPYIGPSLGGCETIVEQVCIMGYFDVPLHERKRIGINNGLVRLSCGIEDTDDLLEDIESALEAV